MRFNITSDSDHQSKVGETLDLLSDTKYRHFFKEKNYSVLLDGITVVFMCQDSKLKLKRSEAGFNSFL